MRHIVIGSAVAGLLAFSAGAAVAGEDWEAKLEEKFAAADANGDGVVSEEEFVAQSVMKARESFAEISGGDGALTLEEAKAAHKAKYDKMKAKKKDKKHKKDKKDRSE